MPIRECKGNLAPTALVDHVQASLDMLQLACRCNANPRIANLRFVDLHHSLMINRNWVIAEQAPDDWQARFLNLPSILRQLLWTREIRESDELERFLRPDYARDLHDPFLFKDMAKALDRIFSAIEKKEKIFIYGDYDADGVPGAAIIKKSLDTFGAVTDIYIPHREKEGYGLNAQAIAYMQEKSAKLVITCDCGISNVIEVDLAKEKGMDVIITDHHRIPKLLPKAFAILHPLIEDEQYPDKYLTGGGIAFKLAQALAQACKIEKSFSAKGGLASGWEKWFLDLAAISTVADVGKLIGENRTIVKYGLLVLAKTKDLGLKKLMEVAGINFKTLDVFSIGWQIAPRINAAGRMDHANMAFKLLMTENEQDAEQLARQLNAANQERQKITEKTVKEARQTFIEQEVKLGGQAPYLLAAFKESWNPGIIGLVAGRLMDEYQKPVIIGTKNEQGKIVASVRSIAEFNIVEALDQSKQFLDKFGGHPKAAGFSVIDESKWDGLIKHLRMLASKTLHEADVRPQLNIDADIILNQIDWEFVGAIQSLEPTGEGNPKPRFLIHGLNVLGFDGVGNGGKHLRLTVTDNSRKPYKMIGFCFGNLCQRLKVGDIVDIVVEIGINEWNGNKEIEMKIVDLRFHG